MNPPMMRRKLVLGLLAFGSGALALSGCTGNEVLQGDGQDPGLDGAALTLNVSMTDPAVVRGDYSLGGPMMDARLEGELVIASGDCLHVATNDGGPTLLAFPRDAEPIVRGRPGVSVAGTDLLVGEQVAFGGGGLELSRAQAEAISGCGPAESIFLVEDVL